ncbi:hypothetical protein ACGFY3_31520 [Streptomyces mirabilis]|uniref:hypothetical protein n=1 Tax=Streptomyces mirabilis TaxID=68239 RepID=UPI003722E487
MHENLYAVIAAGSGAIAAITALQIVLMRQAGSVVDILYEVLKRRRVKGARRDLEKLLKNVDVSEENKAKIRVLLAEADVFRAIGLDARAKEREQESSDIVRTSSPEGDDAR